MPTQNDMKMFQLEKIYRGVVNRDLIKDIFVGNGNDVKKTVKEIDHKLGVKFINLNMPYVLKNPEFKKDEAKFEAKLKLLNDRRYKSGDKNERSRLFNRINSFVIDRIQKCQYDRFYHNLHYILVCGAEKYAKEVILDTRANCPPGQKVFFETGRGYRSLNPAVLMKDKLFKSLSCLPKVEVAYLRTNPGVIVVTVNW